MALRPLLPSPLGGPVCSTSSSWAASSIIFSTAARTCGRRSATMYRRARSKCRAVSDTLCTVTYLREVLYIRNLRYVNTSQTKIVKIVSSIPFGSTPTRAMDPILPWSPELSFGTLCRSLYSAATPLPSEHYDTQPWLAESSVCFPVGWQCTSIPNRPFNLTFAQIGNNYDIMIYVLTPRFVRGAASTRHGAPVHPPPPARVHSPRAAD